MVSSMTRSSQAGGKGANLAHADRRRVSVEGMAPKRPTKPKCATAKTPLSSLAVRFNRERKEVEATGLAATLMAVGFVLAALILAYVRLAR
jgi:hypothetical protein